jgi:hypothetical protein
VALSSPSSEFGYGFEAVRLGVKLPYEIEFLSVLKEICCLGIELFKTMRSATLILTKVAIANSE